MSMTSPAVTVAMPIFNSRPFVNRAIDSALGQSRADLELIVVDDASTDGAAEHVRDRYGADSRVRTFRLRNNHGPAHARNVALRLARGQWFAMLDADDAWRPDRLKTMLSAADHADAVFDNLIGYDAGRHAETGPIFDDMPDTLSTQTLLQPEPDTSGYDYGYLKPVVRIDFLRRHLILYDERLRTGEDLIFYLSLMLRGAQTRVIAGGHYVYTTGVGSFSGEASPLSKTEPRDEDVRDVLQEIADTEQDTLDPAQLQSIKARIAHLDTIGPVSRFYHARRKRDVLRMLSLLFGADSVRRDVRQKVSQRIDISFRRRADGGSLP